MEKTECHCPNCNGKAIREGDEITCEKCDAVFTVKQKEVKVKQLGKLNDLEQRVGRLESLLPGGEPVKEEVPVDGENKDDDSEFIV